MDPGDSKTIGKKQLPPLSESCLKYRTRQHCLQSGLYYFPEEVQCRPTALSWSTGRNSISSSSASAVHKQLPPLQLPNHPHEVHQDFWSCHKALQNELRQASHFVSPEQTCLIGDQHLQHPPTKKSQTDHHSNNRKSKKRKKGPPKCPLDKKEHYYDRKCRKQAKSLCRKKTKMAVCDVTMGDSEDMGFMTESLLSVSLNMDFSDDHVT